VISYTIALYNCHSGRPKDDVRSAVQSIMSKHEVDAMLIQESQHYVPELSSLAGCRMVAHHESGTGLLVRDGIEVSHIVVLPIGTRWWFRDHRMPRRAICWAVLDDKVRLGSYHGPANVFRMMNRIAQQIGLAKAARWLNRRTALAYAMGGDWNDTLDSTVVARFARATKSNLIAAGHFDYVAVRKCRVTHVRKLDEGGSDHPLVLFTLTVGVP